MAVEIDQSRSDQTALRIDDVRSLHLIGVHDHTIPDSDIHCLIYFLITVDDRSALDEIICFCHDFPLCLLSAGLKRCTDLRFRYLLCV